MGGSKHIQVFKTNNKTKPVDFDSFEIESIGDYNFELSDLGKYFSGEEIRCRVLKSDSIPSDSRIVYFGFPEGENYFAVFKGTVTKERKDKEIGNLEKIARDTVDEKLRKGIGSRLDNNVDYGLDNLREDVNKYEKKYKQELGKLKADYEKGQFDKAKTVVETEMGVNLIPVVNGSDDLQKILSNCDDVSTRHYHRAEIDNFKVKHREELKSRREREEARQRGFISSIKYAVRRIGRTKTTNINNIYYKFDLLVDIMDAGVIESDGGFGYLSAAPTQSPVDFIKSQSLGEKKLKFLQAFVYAERASSFFTKICDTGEIVLNETAGLGAGLMLIPTIRSLVNGVD